MLLIQVWQSMWVQNNMAQLNLEDFYINRIEGICLLKNSLYYKIVEEMYTNPDESISIPIVNSLAISAFL